MTIFKAGKDYNNEELHETDFGRIYFATPEESHAPKTVEELRILLRAYHQKGIKVTIRNTGHSMNGQTVTDGVQIRIGNIREKIVCNKKEKWVDVSAGDSWDDVLKAIDFPNYFIPTFPNNPGQKIHMTGTVTMGGIGPATIKSGGFWNHIISLTLVTMKGDLIECSRTVEQDIFRYAVCGMGRIGVVVRMRVRIERLRNEVYGFGRPFSNTKELAEVLTIATKNHDCCMFGYSAQLSVRSLADEVLQLTPYPALFFSHEERAVEEIGNDVYTRINGFPFAYVSINGQEFRMHITKQKFHYSEMVYAYPDDTDALYRANPWSDFVFPTADACAQFVSYARDFVCSKGLERELLAHPINLGIRLDMTGGYVIRNKGDFEFPLSLDFSKEPFAFHYNFSFASHYNNLDDIMRVTNHLNDECYKRGGKKYLYGYHELTSHQLECQYTRPVLDTWEHIKHELDPKYLLNTQAIRMRKGHTFG